MVNDFIAVSRIIGINEKMNLRQICFLESYFEVVEDKDII